jgi:hypothetical protein
VIIRTCEGMLAPPVKDHLIVDYEFHPTAVLTVLARW